ncbi:MAG: adenosylmethionine--8-amino-7-oxononanoate transaminase [Polyangiaceae bacterium]|nr:adenosylmethionine--8-amino-7-oxononanoate transaminase [Polyangiaceae bacterium]
MQSRRQRVVELDARHVWHPYTPMDRYLGEGRPLVIDSASGSRLRDLDGRTYLDGNASWWTALLGHQHPRLVAALVDQARRLCHVPLADITHENAALLATELVAVAPPGLSRVFFSDDGSTAVEVALKLALQYWSQNGQPHRRRFVALDGAFHGETLGVTAIGGVEAFRRPFASAVVEAIHVPPPDESGYERAFDAIARCLEEEGEGIAAVVLEPVVQGAGGMRVYDPKYLRDVRALTRDAGVLLVLDEVFTGYGRTGPMWACDHAGIAPDMLCVAKGFSGGLLPMAATLVSEALFEGFRGAPERAFLYGHTFCGNPLGARVALEVLHVYRDEQILAGVAQRADRIAAAFGSLAGVPGVARVRSLGMVGALDLPGPGGYFGSLGRRVYTEALSRGAILRPLGNTVYVTPALNIEVDDLDALLEILSVSVAAVVGAGVTADRE